MDALKEVARGYEKKSGDKIVFNFGASSFLARQIEAGAPADVFFSADEAQMDGVTSKGLVVKETRKNRLSNTLVIVASGESALRMGSAKDLVAVGRIALAEPRTVPAGVYAREYLEKIGIWKEVSGKVVPTDNVRAALSAVEGGNVDVAIVYKTDARISKKTRVVWEIQKEEGPAIRYPVALLTDAKAPEAGRRWLEFLNGREAGAIFEKFGFLIEQ